MAVTDAQFEAMAPTPYSQARDGLMTGDVLLFHAQNFPDNLIEWATHSPWCHAAFVWRLPDVNRVLVLESVDKFGVRAMPLSTRINGSSASPKPYPGKILVLRHSDFPAPPHGKIGEMTGFALDRLGYPYSPAELVAIAARITAGLAGLTLPGRLDPKNAFICSEYVAKCYEVLGLSLAPDREGFIAPGDIANDPNMVGVYSLVPDTPPAQASVESPAIEPPVTEAPATEPSPPASIEPAPSHPDRQRKRLGGWNWFLLVIAAGLAAGAFAVLGH